MIAVNTSFRLAWWADALYAGDVAWWAHYLPEIEGCFAGERWTVNPGAAASYGANLIPGARRPGASRTRGLIHMGRNSGHGAVSLAHELGARRIILLGFDMQASATGALHFHAPHPAHMGNMEGVDLAVWRAELEGLASDLGLLGVTVVNSTPHSALRVPALALADALQELPAVCVRGMLGLGDNIYQRPYVRALAQDNEVYLLTSWPQLYSDIENVHLLPSRTTLRTQARNEAQAWEPSEWERGPADRYGVSLHPPPGVPSGARSLRIGYRGDIMAGLRSSFGVDPLGMVDLPRCDISQFRKLHAMLDEAGRRPVALVRPVTERKEWLNTARNPLPEYVAQVAGWLRADGFYVVSVADLAAGQEHALDPLPPADLTLHAGELDVLELLALTRAASAVVGGVGWIVPAAIAAHVPLFVILGGQGGHNAPSKITDASMNLSLVGWATPDRFCACNSMRHECQKVNTGLRAQFADWRARVHDQQGGKILPSAPSGGSDQGARSASEPEHRSQAQGSRGKEALV